MSGTGKGLLVILAITVAALALRLPRLQQRPMHTDEAVHAIKFGSLLEEGTYRYDRHEFHGPTLNYLTLIPAWLSSAQNLTEISETTLRIVPVFFGVVLVLMLFWLRDGLGWPAAIIAAFLTAVSPAMVFYSRYYIQEMLMVCFTFGALLCGYRYLQNKQIGWAGAAGVFLGLMHATKETCIIAYGSMLAALLLTILLRPRKQGQVLNLGGAFKPWHGITAIATAFLVSALFYSSFFTHPGGVMDSVLAYKTYFTRAGQNDFHIHPWYYYLKMLVFSKYGNGPVWSEAFIVIFAGIGFWVAIRRKGLHDGDSDFIRFTAFYTFIMTVIYSLIPYKTPWNVLGFLHGMILLAGVGIAALIKYQTNKLIRTLTGLVVLVGAAHLTWQAFLANYTYFEDPRNPYVYAHPVSDIYQVVSRVEEMARVHPDGQNIHVEVIFPHADYWPLPWYLRAFPLVGWWKTVDDKTPPAPVIIASPQIEQDVMRKLYEHPPPGERNLYVPLFHSYKELRPKVEIRGYVRKELWDKFQKSKISSGQFHLNL
ncbi:MAG: flippase activity-associated protein Agl23 [bacterium]